MATTTISSREFNQNTSAAKKAAENGPVFITDRGEPAHVLLSIEEYRKINGEVGSILDRLSMPEGVDICEDFETLLPARTIETQPPFEFD